MHSADAYEANQHRSNWKPLLIAHGSDIVRYVFTAYTLLLTEALLRPLHMLFALAYPNILSQDSRLCTVRAGKHSGNRTSLQILGL